MYYLGVDLGGTSIKVGLVNENYEIISTRSCPTLRERSFEAIIEDMGKLCLELLEEKQITKELVHSIGIGCPGIASPHEGVILFSSNLHFDHVNVREELRKYIDVDVFVENDANCAALGEVATGAARGEKNVVVVTLGTGVGGGIILDGKIYRGSFCGAGEIGHQVIRHEKGRPCGCGRKGCWEQYASATALIGDAKEAAKAEENSLLRRLIPSGDVEDMNAKIVFDAAHSEDETALKVLEQYYKYVAYGVTNLINILEPTSIVIGGGISGQKEYLTEPIKKYVQEEMYGGLQLKTAIKPALLGNDAGIIGAALLGEYL